MKQTIRLILFFVTLSSFVSAQIPMKKGKAKEVCPFVMIGGGLGIPTQHFASNYGDYFYHNASGFAQKGYLGTIDLGLDFPKENCQVSLKTNYGSNPFNTNGYLKYLEQPPTQIYTHPGGTGVNYSAISSGYYKYISFLIKVETQIPVKKFSFGFYCAAGSSRFISFPDVKVAMDSASNHIVTGFSIGKNYGFALNYGTSITYHFNSHFFIKTIFDYFYCHYNFDMHFITPQENGNQWFAKQELPEHYALPVTLLNISLGLGYRL